MSIKQVFTEKFRPKNLNQLITFNRIKKDLSNGLTQNLLLTGTQGTGKTSTLFILSADYTSLYINASTERGIDIIREKISKFCSTISLEGGREKLKCVILDECLSENEEVRIGNLNDYQSIKLKYLEKNKIYPCISFNLETLQLENDTCEIISEKEDDLYEVELENGKKILVTSNHPFIILNNKGKAIQKSINDNLNSDDRVIVFSYIHKFIETIKIKSIIKIEKGKVRNLKVHKNHTFLTSNGIVTHNCDGATEEFFKGLRAVMERYASTARFIASCNYIQKIPEPIQSRFHIISFDPLNKNEEEFLIEEYKKQVKLILDAIKITYTEEALHKFIINDFPDLRALTNKIQSFYDSKITELDPNNFNINYDFKDLFDICLSKPDPIANYKFIGSEYSSRIDDALTVLGKDFPEYLKNNSNKINKLPLIIIAIAEYQYQKSFVIDPIITLLACVFKIQTILN